MKKVKNKVIMVLSQRIEFFFSVMPLYCPAGEQTHTLYRHPRVNAEPKPRDKKNGVSNLLKTP